MLDEAFLFGIAIAIANKNNLPTAGRRSTR